jgi:AcrR family transcriptional regulator
MHEASEAARPPRQAAILAAAVKVFFQFGYRKTSMEDVAAAAEVSRRRSISSSATRSGYFVRPWNI